MGHRAESRAGASVGRQESTARLVEGCLACVQQCDQLLLGISDEVFAARPGSDSSIGAHMRHIIDRYQCFFNGLESGCIDYDDRRRGTRVETEVSIAAGAIAEAQGRFRQLRSGPSREKIVISELVHYDGEPTRATSTLDRELMGLITHSIHHLAIIALLARASDHPVPPNLGKAPSTILAE